MAAGRTAAGARAPTVPGTGWRSRLAPTCRIAASIATTDSRRAAFSRSRASGPLTGRPSPIVASLRGCLPARTPGVAVCTEADRPCATGRRSIPARRRTACRQEKMRRRLRGCRQPVIFDRWLSISESFPGPERHARDVLPGGGTVRHRRRGRRPEPLRGRRKRATRPGRRSLGRAAAGTSAAARCPGGPRIRRAHRASVLG